MLRHLHNESTGPIAKFTSPIEAASGVIAHIGQLVYVSSFSVQSAQGFNRVELLTEVSCFKKLNETVIEQRLETLLLISKG